MTKKRCKSARALPSSAAREIIYSRVAELGRAREFFIEMLNWYLNVSMLFFFWMYYPFCIGVQKKNNSCYLYLLFFLIHSNFSFIILSRPNLYKKKIYKLCSPSSSSSSSSTSSSSASSSSVSSLGFCLFLSLSFGVLLCFCFLVSGTSHSSFSGSSQLY